MQKLLLTVFSMSMAFIGLNAQTQILTGGNLEDASHWQITLLNTAEEAAPTATWNYTTDAPSAGVGGNLHVQGSTTSGNSQYCIYQAVTLSSDMIYTFDGAFKAIALNQSWCEVFIGTQPADGSDYGEGQTRLAAFGTWAGYDQADGIFSVNIDAGNYKTFTPATSGEYFFVMKMGSTSWDGSEQAFEIIVDELTLTEARVKPITEFSVDATNGFAPMTVQFTDNSKFATSWSWDFGDNSAESTDQNPSHTYNAAGVYTVTLTTANEIGETELIKNDYITVNEVEKLTGGGLLLGGNMEDEAKWSTSFLNTAEGNEPTVSWNNTEKTPTAGQDGALLVTGQSNNSTVQYAVYQKVTLSKDSVYVFDAAMRDFTPNLNQSWLEVFIGPEPISGLDYTKDDPATFLLAEFSTWSTECNPKGIDGTFQLNGCGNNAYTPPADGDYYFVLKLGSTSWAGDDMPFQLAIDELSLTASRTAPNVNFSVNNPLGFAPLSVQFTDLSLFGTSWVWDFGDGSAGSTEQNPAHIYENVGTYTVTLTVSNEVGQNVMTKTDYIKANEKPDLPEGQKLYGGNMEDPNLWNITQLNASAVTTATWNNTANEMTFGSGGNLLLSADVLNATSQYCIWQAVELTAGMKYTFTAGFKDISDNLDHFWSEVFIGTTAPADGADYGEGTTKIAFFNTWDCGSSPGLDGSYQDNACGDAPVGVFIPETDGTYYFAIKTGAIDWEGNTYSFKILIDDVSLMESENIPNPVADFFADVTSGDAPLSVMFTDLSTNATSWAWDFGDGNTSSEQSPVHVYTADGIYTVSLTASNEGGSDTVVVEDLITVGAAGIDDIEMSTLSIYPNPSTGLVKISYPGISPEKIRIFDMTGKEIVPEFANQQIGMISLTLNSKGLYFVQIATEESMLIQKIMIQK